MPCSGMRPRVDFFITLKIEAIGSIETSVLTRFTRSHIPEDGIHDFVNCWKNSAQYLDNILVQRMNPFILKYRQRNLNSVQLHTSKECLSGKFRRVCRKHTHRQGQVKDQEVLTAGNRWNC
jgi:hypothetical protein